MPGRRRVFSIKKELLLKSREAALAAVQVFNNPLIKFKSEMYIVLMIIAWTYLLHGYYRDQGIEHRYHSVSGKRRRFDRTKRGQYKYWELERCLNDDRCPLDNGTKNNLRFLIGLRHEVEHQMSLNLDAYLSGRYQACALNFNRYVKELFGDNYGMDDQLNFALQFVEITHAQARGISVAENVPQNLRAYIASFDGALTHEEFNSEHYSYRVLFKRKLASRPGQADQVIEFIDPSSPIAEQIDREYWVQKEVERPKYLPSQIVDTIKAEGYPKFGMHQHTALWKKNAAKSPAKGFGVEIAGYWYWYERWLEEVRRHCAESGDTYK